MERGGSGPTGLGAAREVKERKQHLKELASKLNDQKMVAALKARNETEKDKVEGLQAQIKAAQGALQKRSRQEEQLRERESCLEEELRGARESAAKELRLHLAIIAQESWMQKMAAAHEEATQETLA